MLNELRNTRSQLSALRKDIRAEKGERISRKELRERAEVLGTRWFDKLSPALAEEPALSPDIVERYSNGFRRLVKLSAPNNWKKSYVATLDELLRDFRDELILPIQTGAPEPSKQSPVRTMLAGLPSPEEDVYLGEAVACAEHGFLRAAIVLGWCAAIDRIHHKIEQTGFDKFNTASSTMATKTVGRFKKFKSPQHADSLNELRQVFDTIVLWVLEGMELIDSNQHTRLRSCFDLRCHCAHPGDAPLTEYNLLSFFSDLNEIVFKNPVFQL